MELTINAEWVVENEFITELRVNDLPIAEVRMGVFHDCFYPEIANTGLGVFPTPEEAKQAVIDTLQGKVK